MSPFDQEKLEQAAEGVRKATILGRSATLSKLFDLLLERSLAGEAPKEIEVAEALFARPGADVVNDASVRVYVHRLRRKLEAFYAGEGREEPYWLSLPKGEYRFVAHEADVSTFPPVEQDGVAAEARQRPFPWKWMLGLLLALNLCLLAYWMMRGDRDPMTPLRASAPWAAVLGNDRPLLIVVGDYYMFGDRGDDGKADHFVRRPDVNSRRELEQMLMQEPGLQDRYRDVSLSYVPVGAAAAMRRIAPVVEVQSGSRPFVRVVPMSELTPNMITSCDIVYVGLVSGLGVLKDAVFNGTRFQPGRNGDEIIDRNTKRVYRPDSDPDRRVDTPMRDYAFISALPGPTGTRILIVAGTRDSGLQGAADIVASVADMNRIGKATGGRGFEALYRIDGLADLNYNRIEIAATRRPVGNLWDPASFRQTPMAGSVPAN